MPVEDVVIVGSGASGLACAAALRRRGIDALVLEKHDAVAATWRRRSDGLHLIAGRRASAMPGTRFPRGVGTFPTRDELVAHLEQFAQQNQLRVRTGVTVHRVDRKGAHWALMTTRGPISARKVVVATGLFAEPVMPEWPGRELFGSRLIHSADYRNPLPFVDQHVLVVGAGTTGVEIAGELDAAGARSVTIAVRSRPNLLPRSLGVLPGVKLILKLPTRIGDAQMRFLRRMLIGDLSEQGLPPPPDGPFATVDKRHTTPTNIGPECVRAIRAGRIRIAAAVEALDERGARLVDGSHVDADTIIAATGFSSRLDGLVGHLGVLDARGEPMDYSADGPTSGLHFAGFENVPGQLAFCGEAARRVLREVTAPVVPATSK